MCLVGRSGCVSGKVCSSQHLQGGQEKHEVLGCVGGMVSLGRWSLMFVGLFLVATHGVAVGALPLGFKVKMGLVRG